MDNSHNIKEQIIGFYNDPLYQELKAYYGKTTLFNILKIERNENRHSAFLAWLLDENGSHGLGEEPLKGFMRLLAKMDDKYNEPFLVGGYTIENMKCKTEQSVQAKIKGKTKKGRIDIFISFDYRLKFENGVVENNSNHVCVIVENKIYTIEHDDQTELYRDWARQEFKEGSNQKIIGVFLSPKTTGKCSGDAEDFSYVKITYQEMLEEVIEPLLSKKMSQETWMILMDYVINLGQPLLDDNESAQDNDKALGFISSILAISKTNKQQLIAFYEQHKDLLEIVVCSVNQNNPMLLKAIYGETVAVPSEALSRSLIEFWESNKVLLKMTLFMAFKTAMINDAIINALLWTKRSDEKDSKYLVFAKDGSIMNEEGVPASQATASYYIFNAWLQSNPDTSLNDIRNAFPVSVCAPHYNKTFQYLFYRSEGILNAINNKKQSDKTYYIAELDEDNPDTRGAKKYLKMDFFVDGQNCLKIQDEDVLSIKMWHEKEFSVLVDYAKEKYGIVVEKR